MVLVPVLATRIAGDTDICKSATHSSRRLHRSCTKHHFHHHQSCTGIAGLLASRSVQDTSDPPQTRKAVQIIPLILCMQMVQLQVCGWRLDWFWWWFLDHGGKHTVDGAGDYWVCLLQFVHPSTIPGETRSWSACVSLQHCITAMQPETPGQPAHPPRRCG